jgi:hypothetical protein
MEEAKERHYYPDSAERTSEASENFSLNLHERSHLSAFERIE